MNMLVVLRASSALQSSSSSAANLSTASSCTNVMQGSLVGMPANKSQIKHNDNQLKNSSSDSAVGGRSTEKQRRVRNRKGANKTGTESPMRQPKCNGHLSDAFSSIDSWKQFETPLLASDLDSHNNPGDKSDELISLLPPPEETLQHYTSQATQVGTNKLYVEFAVFHMAERLLSSRLRLRIGLLCK